MFVPRYSEADYERAMRMSRARRSDYAIASELGMSRMTVFNWRHRKPKLEGRTNTAQMWRPSDPQSYSYLLGVYLGDGHLCEHASRNLRLGIKLDERYPAVIEEVTRAIQSVDPKTNVCTIDHPGAIGLYASSPIWRAAFPQHGPGRKHLRAIELAGWQHEISREHPKQLLRGLIHSDGCRCMNRFTTKLPSGRIAEYAYPRYFFSNLSADIRRIFCEHCELLGIRWTQSNPRNISFAHRESVASMDRFIGPKS